MTAEIVFADMVAVVVVAEVATTKIMVTDATVATALSIEEVVTAATMVGVGVMTAAQTLCNLLNVLPIADLLALKLQPQVGEVV